MLGRNSPFPYDIGVCASELHLHEVPFGFRAKQLSQQGSVGVVLCGKSKVA